MNNLDARILSLSPEQRKLLLQHLKREGIQIAAAPIMARPAEINQLPLSSTQLRLWFLEQMQFGTTQYHIPSVGKIVGKLNIAILEQSINEIIKRHEILRTSFIITSGQVHQNIAPKVTIPISIKDLRKCPYSERENEATCLIKEEIQNPFDLSVGPLLRTMVIQLDKEEYIFVCILHHIIADGWSVGVLNRELVALYTAFSAGQQPLLVPLPIQFADYAYWQQQWLQAGMQDHQLAYWEEHLKDAPNVLNLPMKLIKSKEPTTHGAFITQVFPQQLNEDLKLLSQQTGSTLFMVLLAAFNVLLHRFSNQKDICIGTPIANRTRSELAHLIGFFANTLVIRTDISDEPTFYALLQRIRETALKAYENQDIPFEKVVEIVRPDRNSRYNPLFRIMFELNSTAQEIAAPANITFYPIVVESGTAKFEINVIMEDTTHGLICKFEYNTDSFDETFIQQLLKSFRVLLQNIVVYPNIPVNYLQILTSEELRHSLGEWNRTKKDLPLECCFHQLFEEQVTKTPDATAVISKEGYISYRELNQRVNRVAQSLIENQVGPDTLVAILMERNWQFWIAVLAVFKAGGAYIPLDPHSPTQRIKQLWVQSQASIAIISDTFKKSILQVMAELPKTAHPHIFSINEMLQQDRSDDNPALRCIPKNLAYVIYTSGSTGTPKGVMIEHLGMLNHLYAKILALNLSPKDIVAQTASQCFDISVWQFLAPLMVGGTTYIFNDEIAHDPALLLEQALKQNVTILETVPSLLRMMLSRKQSIEYKQALRWIVVTGETFPSELCRQWFEYYSNVPIINAYGATESSDDITHYKIHESPISETVNMPIGFPVENMQIYVLSTSLQPMPVGTIGEIYYGGVGIGRGYLNDSLRTAEVFLPNPFSQVLGERLYKSGDLARYLPDGNIEVLGRTDYQTKIHGFRIELGEIEAVINGHRAVQECIALVQEDIPGEQYLITYVSRSNTALKETVDEIVMQLQKSLKEKLPDYMVPSVILVLEHLPLTSNGKVDRKALPKPDRMQLSLSKHYIPPQTPLEKMLTTIWCEILQVQQVGIQDNFFELGGTSLSVIKICTLLKERANIEIPVVTLFQYSTIHLLTKYLENTHKQNDQLEHRRSLASLRRQRLIEKRTSF